MWNVATLNPYQANLNPNAVGLSTLPGQISPVELDATGTLQQRTFVGMPLSFWIGAVILLAVLKFASEHENTSLQPAHLHVGGYNLLTLIAAWIVGWGLVKLVVNRWFAHTSTASFVNFL